MPTPAAQLKTLARQAKSLKAKVAKLERGLREQKNVNAAQARQLREMEKCCALVKRWIDGKPGTGGYIGEATWAEEVTGMLHQVNWGAIAAAYPGGSGGNPPQDPPDWPPPA